MDSITTADNPYKMKQCKMTWHNITKNVKICSIRAQIPPHSKMSAYSNVLATLGGDLGIIEEIVEDAERALQLAQFRSQSVKSSFIFMPW